MPFVRDPRKKDEWFYWANQERIQPKRTRWRVVLLGESVARGYFYDPHFTPAGVLQKILQSVLGLGRFGCSRFDQVKLADAGAQGLHRAKPRVIARRAGDFCRNNWHPHFAESNIPYVESELRQNGVPGMKAYLDEKREQIARTLVTQANWLLASRNVKIVWVIPEFNLRDWANPASAAPLLPADGNKRWRELDMQMRQAVGDRDWTCAQNSAEQMTRLDGGTELGAAACSRRVPSCPGRYCSRKAIPRAVS